MNQRAAEISDRNSSAVSAQSYAVIGYGVPDYLRIPRSSTVSGNKDTPAALAAVAGTRLIISCNRVVPDHGRSPVHIHADSNRRMISGYQISGNRGRGGRDRDAAPRETILQAVTNRETAQRRPRSFPGGERHD